MTRVKAARPLFSHLLDLTDGIGVFEHALYSEPRREHGYCVDDVARALVVVTRQEAIGDMPFAAVEAGQPEHTLRKRLVRPDELDHAAGIYLRFLARSQTADGRVSNRCDVMGAQHGEPGVEDCWGRALWGWGTAAARSRHPSVTEEAMRRFDLSSTLRSPWPKAMAFAGLGAAEVLRVDCGHRGARSLLNDVITVVGRPRLADPAWPWPFPRLTYANAVIPDVLLAAGDCLGDDDLSQSALALLAWLFETESVDGHLSVTPTAGRGPHDCAPGFDQQPIEVASLADGAARAFDLTGDPSWEAAIERCAAWFFGANDTGVALYDYASGGCCDGLQVRGRNENQGAESTLAMISTLQHTSRLALSRR